MARIRSRHKLHSPAQKISELETAKPLPSVANTNLVPGLECYAELSLPRIMVGKSVHQPYALAR